MTTDTQDVRHVPGPLDNTMSGLLAKLTRERDEALALLEDVLICDEWEDPLKATGMTKRQRIKQNRGAARALLAQVKGKD